MLYQRDHLMSLDRIWKQQLALVSYGNEYLSGQIAIQQWKLHQIFNLHQFAFRDLITQHLLAQHFQVWLESLKKQGTDRISLHHSQLLQQEQNPNANVELLSYTHFIVSHHGAKKNAWIFGQELAEWYSAEEDFIIPTSQSSSVRQMTYWRFELNNKLIKLIEQDLRTPNWDEIQSYMESELFNHPYAQGFEKNIHQPAFYYGQATNEDATLATNQALPILPSHVAAPYAHQMLYQLEELAQFIRSKINHPYDEQGVIFTPEEQLNLRHFAEKIDELTAKFLVKVANHYSSARLSPQASPFDAGKNQAAPTLQSKHNNSYKEPHKVGKSSIITLLIITIIICFIAYRYGL